LVTTDDIEPLVAAHIKVIYKLQRSAIVDGNTTLNQPSCQLDLIPIRGVIAETFENLASSTFLILRD